MLVRITERRFFEPDVIDNDYADVVYHATTTRDVSVDDLAEAARTIKDEGLSFAATGNDWASHPDGSTIVDYSTAEREERTAVLVGFTDAQMVTVINAVDAPKCECGNRFRLCHPEA